jgi:hypothetical protein
MEGIESLFFIALLVPELGTPENDYPKTPER